ncbi:MAG: transglycosylase SLT domain-containing protein, partial [Acidiferrobacter sp.]
LKQAWLHFLAHRHREKTFLRFYTQDMNNDVALHCDDLVARAHVGQQIASSVQALWLTGQSLPRSCQTVTAQWLRLGGATQDNLWARAKLAMHAGNGPLLKRLVPALLPPHALWVNRWLVMQAHPDSTLMHLDYPLLTKRARHIVRAGVVALGSRSPTLAMAIWQRLRHQEPVLGEDNNYVLRGLGLRGAADHLPEALSWLSEAVPQGGNGRLRRWRVRVALRERSWADVLMFIDAMPASWRKQHEWQYWRARALAKTGHPRASLAIMKRLATHFGYYGFLAAGRLGLPYHIPNVPLTEPAVLLKSVAARPEIRMAHELFRLQQHREARALWFHALRGLSESEIEAAAMLASQWGWRDCAILTIAGTEAVHALAIRFPLLYRPLIDADARLNGIDPAWVYGIIRQESAFIFDARSGVGALGLMQLMPQTGFITAREIHLPITGDRDLIDVVNNVDVGTRYLADVLLRARDQEPVATAAYNAGPAAAASWLPVKQPLPADIWIDTIPYRQTRGYVKNVLAFTAIYDYLLKGRQDALKARMAPIPPAIELAADGN